MRGDDEVIASAARASTSTRQPLEALPGRSRPGGRRRRSTSAARPWSPAGRPATPAAAPPGPGRPTTAAKTYDVVVIGSPNVNPPATGWSTTRTIPEIAADFARTFEILKSLPCDIFLGAHGNYYGLEEKYERAEARGAANPFVDPAGYRAYIEDREKAFRATLAEQRKGAAAR